MKPFARNTGPLIRRYRQAKKWSQSDLCHYMGYRNSGQFISNTERRKNNLPPKAAHAIAEALNIPINELMEAMTRDAVACLVYEIEKGRKNDSQLVGGAGIQEPDNRALLQ